MLPSFFSQSNNTRVTPHTTPTAPHHITPRVSTSTALCGGECWNDGNLCTFTHHNSTAHNRSTHTPQPKHSEEQTQWSTKQTSRRTESTSTLKFWVPTSYIKYVSDSLDNSIKQIACSRHHFSAVNAVRRTDAD